MAEYVVIEARRKKQKGFLFDILRVKLLDKNLEKLDRKIYLFFYNILLCEKEEKGKVYEI